MIILFCANKLTNWSRRCKKKNKNATPNKLQVTYKTSVPRHTLYINTHVLSLYGCMR